MCLCARKKHSWILWKADEVIAVGIFALSNSFFISSIQTDGKTLEQPEETHANKKRVVYTVKCYYKLLEDKFTQILLSPHADGKKGVVS